jgi:hypothetical protein
MDGAGLACLSNTVPVNTWMAGGQLRIQGMHTGDDTLSLHVCVYVLVSHAFPFQGLASTTIV